MRTVSIGIDGDEERHEAVRGRGTFRRSLEGLTRARAAGFHDVEAITCVRPGNLDLLPEIERAVRGAGANLWRLITIDRMGRRAGGAGHRQGGRSAAGSASGHASGDLVSVMPKQRRAAPPSTAGIRTVFSP